MNFNTIGFAGLGLIGGSIARTLHRVYPDLKIIAYDTDPSSLQAALAEGILSQACSTLSADFAECDLIFLCAPVKFNIENLKLLKTIASANCLFTDVGSVKSTIHTQVTDLDLDARFIGGHPMAGSEKSGFANSSDRLLENAYYILTPTPQTPADAVDALTALVLAIAAIPVVLGARQHDYITAAISHLPHLIAFTLVNLVRTSDDENQQMRLLAAGGFKDITRIASSSPVMWEQICSENKANILTVLDQYMQCLQEVSDAVQAGDQQYLLDYFAQAKDYRDSISIPSSPVRGGLRAIYEIYVDLIDEPSGIATIATILATSGINIKNIGIVHNREFQEGVLRIEFYEFEALQRAIAQLRKHHYIVHERK